MIAEKIFHKGDFPLKLFRKQVSYWNYPFLDEKRSFSIVSIYTNLVFILIQFFSKSQRKVIWINKKINQMEDKKAIKKSYTWIEQQHCFVEFLHCINEILKKFSN